MAKEYIEREAVAKKAICMYGFGNAKYVPLSAIMNQTAADVVEVVRCRDCKHRGTDECIFHIKGEPADEELLKKLDNDFCSYGEKRDNDG